MNDVLAGVVGGMTATLPMTAAMELWHGSLPRAERHPLPPRRIEEGVAHALGIGRRTSEAEDRGATMLLHFGFGGAAGGVYAAVADRLPATNAERSRRTRACARAKKSPSGTSTEGVSSPSHQQRRIASR
jgi:hypothetical protein